MRQYTVYFQRGWDNYFIGECPAFKGCRTQGETLEKVRDNLKEVIELCIEELEEEKAPLPDDIISEKLEVAV